MEDSRSLTSSQYYEYRKKIRELYKNDVNNNGDLCSSVLQIRDTNKCINSIDIRLKNCDKGAKNEKGCPFNC